MKWLLLNFVFMSCAKLSHYKTYQDDTGLFKYQVKDLKTDNALRDTDNKLIVDKDKADKHLLSFKSVDEIEKSFLSLSL